MRAEPHSCVASPIGSTYFLYGTISALSNQGFHFGALLSAGALGLGATFTCACVASSMVATA